MKNCKTCIRGNVRNSDKYNLELVYCEHNEEYYLGVRTCPQWTDESDGFNNLKKVLGL